MKSVKVRKDELLSVLKDNKDNHRSTFEEAVEGYRQRAVEILQEHIQRIEEGKVERVTVSLPQPRDFTKEYEQAIRMVEMSIDDEIELDRTDFQRFVTDDWEWKREFLGSVAAYTGAGNGHEDFEV